MKSRADNSSCCKGPIYPTAFGRRCSRLRVTSGFTFIICRLVPRPANCRFQKDFHTCYGSAGTEPNCWLVEGAACSSGKVVLYDVRTGARLAALGQEKDIVLAADLSADGALVALGGPSKVVKVFSVADGSQMYQIKKHTDWITALAFSPDGSTLATTDRAGDLPRGRANRAGSSSAWPSTKTRGAATAASGGEDGELVLWNAQDGFPIATDTKTHIPKANRPVYGKPPSGALSVDSCPMAAWSQWAGIA